MVLGFRLEHVAWRAGAPKHAPGMDGSLQPLCRGEGGQQEQPHLSAHAGFTGFGVVGSKRGRV